MKNLPTLRQGDCVEVIAPASRCSADQLKLIKNIIEAWGLKCLIAKNIFGDDLFCANKDEIRFNHLKKALQNPKTKAIFIARGGYGSMRLIPGLNKISIPTSQKIFIGMSDTTALQLYLQQQWQWPTIHGAVAPDRFSQESISALNMLLFKRQEQIEFNGLTPLNHLANEERVISTTITGGNLSLVQASLATLWQIDTRGKIVLLEEIGERGYRIDRIFEQLTQATIFEDALAIIFGDFLEGCEADGTSLIDKTLKRFAKNCPIPVFQVPNIGHGYHNFPIPLGITAKLKLGRRPKLSIRL